jgi:hypothetical protein
LLTSAVLCAVLTYWIVRVARGTRASKAPDRTRLTSRLRAGLLAGLVGGLESSLALNTVLGVIGLTVVTPGHEAHGLAGAFDQMLTPLIGLLNAPGLPTLAFWGAAYGLAVEHEMRITPWLRGVVFALVPMTISLVAIVPLATWSLLGIPFHELREPLAIETSRHLIYGLTLGVVYPLLLRRAPEPLPPPPPPVSAGHPNEAPDLTAPVA